MWNVPSVITSRIGLILGVGVLLFSSLGCSVNNTAPRGKGKAKAKPPEAVVKVREIEDADDVFDIDDCEDGCEDVEIIEGEACEFLEGVFTGDDPCNVCDGVDLCDACGGAEIISEPITESGLIGTPTVCEGAVLDGKCVILSGGELTVMLDEKISILGEDSAVKYYDESQIVREYLGDPMILDDEAVGEYVTEGEFFTGDVVTEPVIINTSSPAVVTKYAAAAPVEKAVVKAAGKPQEKSAAKSAGKPQEKSAAKSAAKSGAKQSAKPAQSNRHKVPFQSVIDGETISVLWLNEDTQVKLAGAEAPEADSPAAKKAEKLLRKLIGDREVVELEFPNGEVRYDAKGRLIATVWVRGVNLSAELGRSSRAK